MSISKIFYDQLMDRNETLAYYKLTFVYNWIFIMHQSTPPIMESKDLTFTVFYQKKLYNYIILFHFFN